MSKVVADPLHTWVMQPEAVDEEALATSTEASGAVVMGRNDVFDSTYRQLEQTSVQPSKAVTHLTYSLHR